MTGGRGTTRVMIFMDPILPERQGRSWPLCILRIPIARGSGTGGALCFHDAAVAGRVELHTRHVGAHEEEAAAGSDRQVFRTSAVGHVVGNKARALVTDLNPEPLRRHFAGHVDALA